MTMNDLISVGDKLYPRYLLAPGRELEQGDILFDCPVLLPLDEQLPMLLQPPEVRNDEVFGVRKRRYDLTVITQFCDLERRADGKYKVDTVLLCPHWELHNSPVPKSQWDAINKGRMPRYHLLGRSDLSGAKMEIRVVDLGQLLSLPLSYVQLLAENQGQRRLRLGSPYKEHLSQAFARFFMRVGLPQDIRLD